MTLPAAKVGDATSDGGVIATGSHNVFINNLPAAIAGKSAIPCPLHGGAALATGSCSVFINSLPAGRVGDVSGCGGAVVCGSPNVFIG
ncbi:PAAR domain-containing protein [Serratia sp. UGAL515B_01]|uniref:PAAR domain-containing protein n=1 Tax=Serratia sp. UGAL515B_01 TaxID=2986763 RepID=UPI002955A1D1|nr:PAAR domain-containing protein [Serratia sp. UGAL515B_01]WON77491.1 PAAR domain-containing protein [Serratia sp. UGAL515B_01]